MILNCAIVDDEPLALELLQSYVEKTAFLRLAGKYSSAVQAMNEIPAHEEIHILFSRHTNAGTERIRVFTHGEPRNTHHLHYRFRPIRIRQLQGQCAGLPAETDQLCRFPTIGEQSDAMVRTEQKAGNRPEEEVNNEYIYVKSDYKLVQIALDKILYIEGLKDYIKIHIENEPKANLVTYQHEGYGRKASVKAFCTCTSLIHSAKKQNKGD